MAPLWHVTTRVPSAALQPFVMEYSYRTVKIPAGQELIKAMPVWCQSTIDFCLSGHIANHDFATGREIPFSRSIVRGLRTTKRNYIRLSGDFTIFIVRLTPGGVYGLLHVPAQEFSDRLIDCRLLQDGLFTEITERLMACTDVDGCVSVIEPYLLQMAYKPLRKTRLCGAADYMTSLITASRVPPAIGGLQEKICLSKRQLERNFTRDIGTTPKYFSRMVRFTNMLYYKMHHREIKWPALAYEFNYTDQMHLIRDFQHFLGLNPSEFSPADFACLEEVPPSLMWNAK